MEEWAKAKAIVMDEIARKGEAKEGQSQFEKCGFGVQQGNFNRGNRLLGKRVVKQFLSYYGLQSQQFKKLQGDLFEQKEDEED